MHTQEFVEEMKQKLLAQKQKLQTDLAGLQPHTEMGDSDDENADEINVDEVSQDVIARMRADLEKIETALQKIQNGTYGVDADGNDISEDRLRAIPWAEKGI